MNQNRNFSALAVFSMIILLLLSITACSGGTSYSTGTPVATSPAIGGGLVVQSDSVITGEISAIRQQTTGYPWQMLVLVQSSQDVDSLPNPTKDKVGQVITAITDENLANFRAGQMITAKVKYVGDVPRPGISYYIYNVQAK